MFGSILVGPDKPFTVGEAGRLVCNIWPPDLTRSKPLRRAYQGTHTTEILYPHIFNVSFHRMLNDTKWIGDGKKGCSLFQSLTRVALKEGKHIGTLQL